jgi:death-on-curing protein
MISLEEVLEVHTLLIARFGGSFGVRDKGMLESSLKRPFQQFEDRDLYSTVIHKAASLVESILINHPFIDGNKRVGYTLLRYFLLSNGMDLYASEAENTGLLSMSLRGNSVLSQLWIG